MADLQALAALLGKDAKGAEAAKSSDKSSEKAKDGDKSKRGYDGKVVQLSIQVESKGRGGKTVTVIRGFQSRPQELEELAQRLKKKSGTGGTVGDNTIELQGDQRQAAERFLSELGYQIKASQKKK